MVASHIPHMIVPFASMGSNEWLSVMSSIKLTSLSRLLRTMKLVETDTGQPHSLSPAHERVWAKALALDAAVDGQIPWAAFHTRAKPGEACAFITPCHWAMGREHATLTDPLTLSLPEAQSRTLLAAMQPYFATEGITLDYLEPTCWLATGKVFESLPCASLDRVLGRNVDQWLNASTAMKLLQNEMQMLLYTHPVNDVRSLQGLSSVNSFWLSGSGALVEPAVDHPHVSLTRALALAALGNDWTAYGHAWMQLDEVELAQLLARQTSGETVRISLCGESNAMTFETAPRGILSRFKGIFSPQPIFNVLKQL